MKNQKLISRNAIRKKLREDMKSFQEKFPIERGINGEHYYIYHTPESNHVTFSDIMGRVFEIPDILLGNDHESRIQTRMKRDGLTRAQAELIEGNTQTGVAPIPGRVGGYRNPVITQNTRAFQAARRPTTTVTVRPTGANPKTVTTTRNYVGEAEQAAKVVTEKQAERWLNLRDPLSRIRVTTNTSRGMLNEPSLEGTMNIGTSFKDKVNLFFDKLKRVNSSKIIKRSGIIGGPAALYILHSNQRNNNDQSNNQQNNASLSPWSSNINTNTLLSPWNKTKNSNAKLSPWSTNQNNNSQNNVRTSGNIWSLQRSDGSVKNFRDSVIDYQNSHSTNNDMKFNIPLGDVPVNENDSLIRETIPNVETMMPKSIFTNLRGSVRRNPVQLTTSNSIEYRLPSSLAEYKSKNPTQSSNSSDVTTTSEQEKVAPVITQDEMISEILAYIANGNKIDGINDVNDINKLEPQQIQGIFRQIQRIYADEGTTPKEYEPGYEPKQESKKEEKQQTSTSPFAGTTPSSVDLNRADVRAIMSHYGLDTTPSQRKAFRKYLAGDRSQDISFIDQNSNLHRDWVAPFVVYKKKGGRLVSRNLVERFQKGKAIKGAQKVIYNTLATPIHAIFGNPGKRRGYGGGRFGGAGVSGKWSNPTYSYNEIHPADTLFVPVTQTFNDAFADARRRGLDTFEFNGGTYGTELGDNPNWEAAGNARTRDAVIPVPIPADTIRRTSDVPRNDTIITDDAYRRYPISTSNINKIFNK